MTIQTLQFSPEYATYSVMDADNRVSAQYGIGGRYRRNFFNSPKTVNVTWQADKPIYNYLAQAYRAFEKSGGKPFYIWLSINKLTLSKYEAIFVTDSFKLVAVKGESYLVSAKLEVTPEKYDVATKPWVTDAGLNRRAISLVPGVYVLTGRAVSFRLSVLRMPALSGFYNLGGGDVILVAPAKSLSAASGSYTLIGNAAELSASSEPESLLAGAGSYSVSGQSANLTVQSDIEISAEAGAYSISGADATLEYVPLTGDGSGLRSDDGFELRSDNGKELRSII